MKSWKTTLVGAITAVVVALYPIVMSGTFEWKNVIAGAVIALFGYLAKDHDVTGKP